MIKVCLSGFMVHMRGIPLVTHERVIRPLRLHLNSDVIAEQFNSSSPVALNTIHGTTDYFRRCAPTDNNCTSLLDFEKVAQTSRGPSQQSRSPFDHVSEGMQSIRLTLGARCGAFSTC